MEILRDFEISDFFVTHLLTLTRPRGAFAPKISWDLSQNCMRYTWDINEISLRYACNMPEICLIICMRFAWDLPWNELDVPEIYLRFSWDMPDICLRYSEDIHEIFMRYVWDISEIGHFDSFWTLLITKPAWPYRTIGDHIWQLSWTTTHPPRIVVLSSSSYPQSQQLASW